MQDRNLHIARAHSRQSECASHTQIEAWCRLLRDCRWSQKQKYRLIKALESPEDILASDDRTLGEIAGRKAREDVKEVVAADVHADLDWLAQPNNHLITLNSTRFPKLLKQLADPPVALFASGNLALLDDPKVAVVGSRRPTPVGAKLVQQLAADLAQLGLVVTSGMALGVDGLAHQAALAAQGPSIAVMGCGLDIIYPARNRGLFQQLKECGLILSEYPLGYKPTRFSFPQRNRIVSGLSHGVIIVEAAERSGTLITARLALDQDRELMVVPGSSLSAQYAGSHQLLKEGATLVTSAQDVLHALEQSLQQYLISNSKQRQSISVQNSLGKMHSNNGIAEGNSQEHSLLQYIGADSTPINQLICASGMPANEVSALLLILELDGLVSVDNDGGVINLS